MARGSRLTFSSIVAYCGNRQDAAVVIIAGDRRHRHDVLWLLSALIGRHYLGVTAVVDVLEVTLPLAHVQLAGSHDSVLRVLNELIPVR